MYVLHSIRWSKHKIERDILKESKKKAAKEEKKNARKDDKKKLCKNTPRA